MQRSELSTSSYAATTEVISVARRVEWCIQVAQATRNTNSRWTVMG